ncbi:hypothetical protein Q604_UNBC10835G0001, partial [human gut metagenome]
TMGLSVLVVEIVLPAIYANMV